MNNKLAAFLWVFVFLPSISCNVDEDRPEPSLYTVNTFENDAEGWEALFADYPQGLEDSLKLSFDYGSFFPSELIGDVKAIIQTGYAANSDLFMFIKKQISGLEPEKQYAVVFNIELYAQLNQEYEGDIEQENKGSFLKSGVFTDEPGVILADGTGETPDTLVPDFQIGEANEAGLDMINVGKLEYTIPGATPVINFGSSVENPVNVMSDADGKVWLVLGVDTNIPVYMSIYYSNITVNYKRVD